VTALHQGADGPDPQDHEETADEQIGGQAKHDAGFSDSAQVDEGDDRQRDQAQREGVGVQHRHGGHQRPDPGRDADGNIQDIVQHEGRRREEPGPQPEILLRDRIGSPAPGIRGDRLTIGEVQDGEQGEDDHNGRPDIGEADGAQRHQDREGGLGAIRRRGETIKTEDGDAGGDPDLLLLLLGRSQRFTEERVKDGHDRPCRMALLRDARERDHGSARHKAVLLQ